MIDITYLDGAKQERVMHFDSYEEFERSQQACLIGVADFYPVCKKRIFYFVLGCGKYCIYKKRRMRYDDRDGTGSCCLGRREQ